MIDAFALGYVHAKLSGVSDGKFEMVCDWVGREEASVRVLFIAYDNDSHISFFPLGYAYLAAACRAAGHEALIYQQDTHHWPDSHLTKYLDENNIDVVGLGACAGYYQYRRILSLSAAINNSKKRPFYILGGTIATPEPEYFLRKTGADAVVLGEGEGIICELLNALSSKASKASLSNIKGVAYMSGGEAIINERPDPPDLNDLPFPAWDLFEMDHYVLNTYYPANKAKRTMAMLSGRGCPYHCTFCYRMEGGMRLRDVDSIIEEASKLVKDYDIGYLHFYDELVISSPQRAIELSEAIIKAGLNAKWGCAGRLNIVTQEALHAMKAAGCEFIGYGMESMDDEVLRRMNKQLTSETILRGVEMTMDAGIMVGFNFIFGNFGDTKESLQKSVDFLIKYDRQSQVRTIRPVTPYPGCPLYTFAVRKGMIKDCEDFYENVHTNSDLLTVNFSELSDDEFYSALHSANKQLLDNYYRCNQKSVYETLDNLYINRDASFRGFRKV